MGVTHPFFLPFPLNFPVVYSSAIGTLARLGVMLGGAQDVLRV